MPIRADRKVRVLVETLRCSDALRKGVSFGVWYADDFVDKRPEYVGLYTQCATYVENACEFGCGDENLFVIAAYSDLDSQADEWLALAERGDILDAMSDYCV